jgi:hypothetical protein
MFCAATFKYSCRVIAPLIILGTERNNRKWIPKNCCSVIPDHDRESSFDRSVAWTTGHSEEKRSRKRYQLIYRVFETIFSVNEELEDEDKYRSCSRSRSNNQLLAVMKNKFKTKLGGICWILKIRHRNSETQLFLPVSQDLPSHKNHSSFIAVIQQERDACVTRFS